MKAFKRALARQGLFISTWLFERLPYSVVRGIMSLFIAIGFQFTIKQRHIARESLSIAFGDEKSPEEINNIIKQCFTNFGRGMMEMAYFMSHPELVAPKITIEGKEHLDRAIEQGKGVIAVTAHFGNFPLMMLHCAQAGYKVHCVIRPARDQVLEEFLFKKRKDIGLQTVYAVPRQKCVENSLKVLRNKEILFIPLDQNFGSGGGVFVNFFGQKAATATGPVVFAARTRAAILPMFIIRQKDDTHKIVIEAPIKLEDTGDEQKNNLVNTEKITNLIERYIRRYPHEWGWMHRRWKSRPA